MVALALAAGAAFEEEVKVGDEVFAAAAADAEERDATTEATGMGVASTVMALVVVVFAVVAVALLETSSRRTRTNRAAEVDDELEVDVVREFLYPLMSLELRGAIVQRGLAQWGKERKGGPDHNDELATEGKCDRDDAQDAEGVEREKLDGEGTEDIHSKGKGRGVFGRRES